MISIVIGMMFMEKVKVFVIYNNDEDDIDREIDDLLHSLGF